MVVKTYRGQITSAGAERIRLSTIKGTVGYRIIKFESMPLGVNLTIENVMKIYKTPQTAGSNVINFTDSDLLAATILKLGSSSSEALTMSVIFDREIFNQDISITSRDDGGSNRACNYYLELEVIPLASDEAAITTVKAMRGQAVD